MQTQSAQSMQSQSLTEMGDPVSSNIDALDVTKIKSIETASGWYNVTNCRFIHFAVGESHSPIVPDKLYPALRYEDRNGNTIRTPLNKVISFSEKMSSLAK